MASGRALLALLASDNGTIGMAAAVGAILGREDP
jgi:hypothetical protein